MRPEETKICVVGLGYIGLPTSALFARAGFTIHGVDVDPRAVEAINAGRTHIVEPGLEEVVAGVVAQGRLKAGLEPTEADVFLMAVPTPFKGEHEPDISYIEAATRSIAPYLRPGNLVVLESTSPVGTTEMLAATIKAQRPDLTISGEGGGDGGEPIYVAHAPERVLPGYILRELVENERVIGGLDRVSAERAGALYGAVVTGEIHLTTARAAEMSKLTENAFRDVNIAFANELSFICEQQGIDVWELIKLANLHPRVNILNPGPGVGGHCIAVDPWFIVHASPKESRLIRMAREINDEKPHWVVDQVKAAVNGKRDPVIACLGLAYKADIDDLRESPAVEIAEQLGREKIGRVLAVEPHVDRLPKRLDGLVELASLEEALASADVLALLVDHAAFKAVPREALAGKAVIDTRGVWRLQST